MPGIRIAISVFCGLLSAGLLFFLYVFPDRGLIPGLLEFNTSPSALRDASLTTALAALNIVLAVTARIRRPAAASTTRYVGLLVGFLAVGDASLALVSSDRPAWIPWLDILSAIHALSAFSRPLASTK